MRTMSGQALEEQLCQTDQKCKGAQSKQLPWNPAGFVIFLYSPHPFNSAGISKPTTWATKHAIHPKISKIFLKQNSHSETKLPNRSQSIPPPISSLRTYDRERTIPPDS